MARNGITANLAMLNMRLWSDDKLVSALIDGNQNAIVYFFYEKFSSTFQYHIYRIFPYKVDVAELVDEFFLYMYEDNWRRLRTYSGSVKLSTWISVVSFRFFRNYKETKIDFNGLITISDQWEAFRGDWCQSIDMESVIDINDSIERISNARDRMIAKRIFIEDKPFEKVAEEFGMTVDYVYTVKNRILKSLRKSLKG